LGRAGQGDEVVAYVGGSGEGAEGVEEKVGDGD
jgi:hypothetical protein